MDTPVKPALDELQVAINSRFGNLHQLGGFCGGATKKISQFDQLHLVRIYLAELIEGPVQVEQFGATDLDPWQIITQGDVLHSATAHLRLVSSRVIDENHAHDLGRECVEMLAVFPPRLLLVQEPKVEFVDEGRGLENVWISFPSHIGGSYFPEVRVDKRHQLLKGRGLAVSPFRQKQSDLALGWLQKTTPFARGIRVNLALGYHSPARSYAPAELGPATSVEFVEKIEAFSFSFTLSQ